MSTVVMTKEHCPCPDCGSSDALCYYSDGHSYCFSCQRYRGETKPQEAHVTGDKNVISESEMYFDVLRARGIRKETCAKYGYYKAHDAQVACYYNDDGTLLGQKLRESDLKQEEESSPVDSLVSICGLMDTVRCWL